MKCKHRCRKLTGRWARIEAGVIFGRHGVELVGPARVRVTFEECLMCGDELTGIPSNDEAPGVSIEIAAARIADGRGFANVMHKDDHQALEIMSADEDALMSDVLTFVEDCDGCQIDHLVHVMATHELVGAPE